MEIYTVDSMLMMDDSSMSWIDVRPAAAFIRQCLKQSHNLPYQKDTPIPQAWQSKPIVVVGPAGIIARRAAESWRAQGHLVAGYVDEPFARLVQEIPQHRFHGATVLSPEALSSWNGTLLDVRLKNDARSGTIAGSVWIPLPELQHAIGALSREKPVLTYCNSGSKALEAAAKLLSAGFLDVSVIAQGGMENWYRQGRPTEVCCE
ncbi:MAG: rhodanese-like domain-containing protein [Sulfobacillus sp.]